MLDFIMKPSSCQHAFEKKFAVFLRVAEMARTAAKPLRSVAARFRAFRL